MALWEFESEFPHGGIHRGSSAPSNCRSDLPIATSSSLFYPKLLLTSFEHCKLIFPAPTLPGKPTRAFLPLILIRGDISIT